MVSVELVDFPVALFEAFDQVTEGLLREYMMVAAQGAHPYDLSDVATAAEVKHGVAAAVSRAMRIPTVTLDLSGEQAAAFQVMQAVLEHVNVLAAEEKLLALPVLPEISAFRNWMCAQVAAQSNGTAPTPWRLPTQFEPGISHETGWAGVNDLPTNAAWLVGDDANRIIAASPAALVMLGWDSLVGERLLAVIPPRYREQHIIAFTRGVALDEYRSLDQPLPLEALTRDGREIPINLTLSRHGRPSGRVVFVAMLTER